MKTSDRHKRCPRLVATFISLLILSCHVTFAQNDQPLTLSSAVNRALRANVNLAAAQADLEANLRQVDITRAGYLPSIDFLGSISESKTASYSESLGVLPSTSGLVGGSLTQMIYNQKTLASHKIQKQIYAGQQEQYRNTRYATISSTTQAYIGVLMAADLLEIQQINLAVTNKNLQVAYDRFNIGSTDLQEVLRWQTQKYANEQQVNSENANLIISRGSLNQLLNIPIETIDSIERLTLERDGFIFSNEVVAESVTDENKARIIRDYMVEIGLKNSPIIAGIERQLEAQNFQLKSDKRWAIPELNLAANADSKFLAKGDGADPSQSSGMNFWKVGVKLNWPIVDGGANVARVKQARSELSALEYQKINVETSLELTIRATLAVVISDFLNVRLASAQADAAKHNFDLVLDSYYVGETTLMDLLDAQEQLLGAQISEKLTLYTFFMDLTVVEQTIGYFPFLGSSAETNAITTEIANRFLDN